MSAGGLKAAAACVAAAVALSGGAAACGEGHEAAPAPGGGAPAWVDPEGEPPYVASLDANPADGSLFLATNTGLFVIAPGARRPQRLTGQLRTPVGSAQVSRALAVRFTGPDTLLGSGHPDTEGTLPGLLGLIRSRDAGRTWSSVSALGDSDFHDLQAVRGRLVVSVAGVAEALVSGDGGRTFERRALPLPLVDLEVDPRDPRRWIATTVQGIFTSADEGQTWRQREPTAEVRVAWAADGTLYRADPEGTVAASADGGATWQPRGRVGEQPQALAAEGRDALFAALLDGSVLASQDGGRTWTVRVRGG